MPNETRNPRTTCSINMVYRHVFIPITKKKAHLPSRPYTQTFVKQMDSKLLRDLNFVHVVERLPKMDFPYV